MNTKKVQFLVLPLLFLNLGFTEACYKFQEPSQKDFLYRWKDLGAKTIYDGDNVQELVDMCPSGCSGSCPIPSCTDDDIKILRKAQDIAKGWQQLVTKSRAELVVHFIVITIVVVLIVILIVRGHYRVRDLWYLSLDRQWEVERDPTWGLPGKVWSLLKVRVVKKANTEPTDRKHFSYTENPTVMGNKFWYYKHALRQTYKPHKYYKRNRYFQKLAWQVAKLGKVIPETLRHHKKKNRYAGEVEALHNTKSTPDENQEDLLPPEVDLPGELNATYLRQAKQMLRTEVEREKERGLFINGRFQPQEHYKKFRPNKSRGSTGSLDIAQLPPLTKQEVQDAARQKVKDPNAGFVTVDSALVPRPMQRLHKQLKYERKQEKRKKSEVYSSLSRLQQHHQQTEQMENEEGNEEGNDEKAQEEKAADEDRPRTSNN
ncbi:hypothetical protein Ocin01_03788 [Orchesella cincta]|uniref:Uncharacterized protein n=1 Tax=Orchesella cincta TaxID=48709 RepID=A0A1D2NCC1_ORCCI|nr:hypothetical protein Ocin01_03788 [Orchesella cincta]